MQIRWKMRLLSLDSNKGLATTFCTWHDVANPCSLVLPGPTISQPLSYYKTIREAYEATGVVVAVVASHLKDGQGSSPASSLNPTHSLKPCWALLPNTASHEVGFLLKNTSMSSKLWLGEPFSVHGYGLIRVNEIKTNYLIECSATQPSQKIKSKQTWTKEPLLRRCSWLVVVSLSDYYINFRLFQWYSIFYGMKWFNILL